MATDGVARASAPFPLGPGTLREVRTLARGRRELLARFEAEVTNLVGTRFTVATPSCRAGLYLTLTALGLPGESEVLLAPVTHWDMVNMILSCGLRPAFVDLGDRTGAVDPVAAEARIGPSTRVLLVTHLHGIPSDMVALSDLAERHNLVLIEDASYGIGATLDDRPMGGFARASVLSTSQLKPINTLSGGLLVTDDESLEVAVRRAVEASPLPSAGPFLSRLATAGLMRTALGRWCFPSVTLRAIRAIDRIAPGRLDALQRGDLSSTPEALAYIKRRPEGYAPPLTRPTALQGLLGMSGARTLLERRDKSADNGARLRSALAAVRPDALPRLPAGARPAYWQFPLWLDDRRSFREHMYARGVDTSIGGLAACNLAPAFRSFAAETPHAVHYMEQVCFLPVYAELTTAQLDQVIDAATSGLARG